MADVRVVLADDHGRTRVDLRTALAEDHGIEVVAEAGDGHSALRQALLHRPDVLMVEPGMPDGPTVIRHVLRSAPGVAVLAMTDDDKSLHAAIRAGARGYIRKDASAEAVIRAIRCVATGNAILGPTVTARLAELIALPAAYQKLPLPGLTAREHEVLDLMAEGLANAAIAGRLRVAAKTLRNHITAIFTKLGVTDRQEAIAKAQAVGLGKRPKFDTARIPA